MQHLYKNTPQFNISLLGGKCPGRKLSDNPSNAREWGVRHQIIYSNHQHLEQDLSYPNGDWSEPPSGRWEQKNRSGQVKI